jgi:hypothetical protein
MLVDTVARNTLNPQKTATFQMQEKRPDGSMTMVILATRDPRLMKAINDLMRQDNN